MRLVRHSGTARQTRMWGEFLGRHLGPGDVVALFGKLGAGKTCFAQGLARGVGVGEDVVVSSPSFVIVGEYHGRCPFYHIDLYRLPDAGEVESLGLEEYVGTDGVVVIEWAERAEWLLGPEAVKVWMRWRSGDERTLVMEAPDRYLRDLPGAAALE